MPISCKISIPNLSEDEFLARDAVVMRCAYASQNILGRLCEEKVYENDLAARLRSLGTLNVLTQVPIEINHGVFKKEYRLDLVADGAVYELKTVDHYTGAHFSQVYNYAMCLDIKFIKLLNFRPSKVDGKLRVSPITSAIRHTAQIIPDSFTPVSSRCAELRQHLQALLNDLGGFLETNIYTEALSALTKSQEVRLVVVRDGLELGSHPLRLLDRQIGFHVSSHTQCVLQQRTHLERLFATLPLKALHWINFNHEQVNLSTLKK